MFLLSCSIVLIFNLPQIPSLSPPSFFFFFFLFVLFKNFHIYLMQLKFEELQVMYSVSTRKELVGNFPLLFPFLYHKHAMANQEIIHIHQGHVWRACIWPQLANMGCKLTLATAFNEAGTQYSVRDKDIIDPRFKAFSG